MVFTSENRTKALMNRFAESIAAIQEQNILACGKHFIGNPEKVPI